MPRGNGRDLQSRGDGSGRGQGRGAGRGMGWRRPGFGPGGNCVCRNCGIRVPHRAGKPCSTTKCPKCGVQMFRE